ncbi:MAG: hypothetical protein ABIP94_25075 [Planctomycetota bacterium]
MLSVSPNGLTIRASKVSLPAHVVAAGSCAFGSASPLLWSCADDGSEDWFVPLELRVPASFRQVLQALEADLIDEPRRLDVSVVIGHLAAAMSDGEPRADLLHLGGSLCGEVTWIAWRTQTHLRVRGRSGGGLLLPAALIALASEGSPGVTTAMSLRAFGSRDGDRSEAARQLSRTSGEALVTLRALLCAEDQVRFAAIDALVRLRAVEEMPRIVAAADPAKPWASLAAADAVRTLWVDASPLVRERTRVALAQSPSRTLRAIDTASLATKRPAPPLVEDVGDTIALERPRSLLLLFLLAVGVHGLWRRERSLLRGTDS